jgi:hypothetical protein
MAQAREAEALLDHQWTNLAHPYPLPPEEAEAEALLDHQRMNLVPYPYPPAVPELPSH